MKRILFLMATLICMSWGQAYADYSFTFNNNQYGATGTLTTADNGNGTFTVIGGYVTGTGSSNTGVVYSLVSTQNGSVNGRVQTDSNNNNVPLFKDAIGTNIDFDNLLMPSSKPILTSNGLLFASSVGIQGQEQDINFYATGASAYKAFGDPGYYTVDGTVSATPTPIPAAAFLFGSGLFGLFGLKKRKNG